AERFFPDRGARADRADLTLACRLPRTARATASARAFPPDRRAETARAPLRARAAHRWPAGSDNRRGGASCRASAFACTLTSACTSTCHVHVHVLVNVHVSRAR